MAAPDTEPSPAERVRALCAAQGESVVAAGCAEILRSGSWQDRDLVEVLGGRQPPGHYGQLASSNTPQQHWLWLTTATSRPASGVSRRWPG